MNSNFSLIQIASTLALLFASDATAVEQQRQHQNSGRTLRGGSRRDLIKRREMTGLAPSSEAIINQLATMPATDRRTYVAEHGISLDHFFISVGAAATMFIRPREEEHSSTNGDGFYETGVESYDYLSLQQGHYSFHLEALAPGENDCDFVLIAERECRNLYFIEGIGGASLRADADTGVDEEGISAYDPAREIPNPFNDAWLLQFRSSKGDDDDLITIHNLNTGRTLFAEETTLSFQLGGRSPSQFNVEEDQLFRHCIKYSLESSEYFSCKTGFVLN